MALYNDFNQAFFMGKTCFNIKDFINARYWYEIAARDPKFKNASLFRLIQIEIKEGKYSNVRKMLVENNYANNAKFKQLYGLLENIENNFEQSKKYFCECMVDSNMQHTALLEMAKLYIQTGDYEVARKIFETLQLNPKFYVQATFGLVCLYILSCDFFEAQKILNKIDTSKLTPKLASNYRTMYYYVKYFLGQLRMSDNKFDPVINYMLYRLFDHSEEILLNHIERHCDQSKRYSNGCFFQDIDIKKLLYDARDRIQNMNANHFECSDMYRYRLDYPIGYKGDLITNDLCVVTMIGTKDIITLYPVSLSDEFDKEGLATSKELKLKRLQGELRK